MSTIEEEFFMLFDVPLIHCDGCRVSDLYIQDKLKYSSYSEYLNLHCSEAGNFCYSTCEHAYDEDEYPEITTGILVNMLCSLNKYKKTCQCRPPVTGTTFEKVKECILKDMTDIAHKFSVFELNNKDKAAETLKKEVRELFEE